MKNEPKPEDMELIAQEQKALDAAHDIITKFTVDASPFPGLLSNNCPGTPKTFKLLDLACGEGPIAVELGKRLRDANKKGSEVYAVDYDIRMVQEAARYLTDNHLINYLEVSAACMDAHELNLDDDFFDHAYCQMGFQFFEHPVRCLFELTRVVKPGGSVTIVTNSRIALIEAAIDAVASLTKEANPVTKESLLDPFRPCQPKSFSTPESMSLLIQNAEKSGAGKLVIAKSVEKTAYQYLPSNTLFNYYRGNPFMATLFNVYKISKKDQPKAIEKFSQILKEKYTDPENKERLKLDVTGLVTVITKMG